MCQAPPSRFKTKLKMPFLSPPPCGAGDNRFLTANLLYFQIAKRQATHRVRRRIGLSVALFDPGAALRHPGADERAILRVAQDECSDVSAIPIIHLLVEYSADGGLRSVLPDHQRRRQQS
jgi:hypothetical protein